MRNTTSAVILMPRASAAEDLLFRLRRSRSYARYARIRMTALALVIPTIAAAQTQSLKDAFKDAFLIGAAMNVRQFSEVDAKAAALVRAQYNTISPENSLKWEVVHQQPDRYDFTEGDQ